MTDREKFEAWYVKIGYPQDRLTWFFDNYVNSYTQAMWNAWQAAIESTRRQQPANPDG
jgi:hypothetical protein